MCLIWTANKKNGKTICFQRFLCISFSPRTSIALFSHSQLLFAPRLAPFHHRLSSSSSSYSAYLRLFPHKFRRDINVNKYINNVQFSNCQQTLDNSSMIKCVCSSGSSYWISCFKHTSDTDTFCIMHMCTHKHTHTPRPDRCFFLPRSLIRLL